jgi:hypothetical protein
MIAQLYLKRSPHRATEEVNICGVVFFSDSLQGVGSIAYYLKRALSCACLAREEYTFEILL